MTESFISSSAKNLRNVLKIKVMAWEPQTQRAALIPIIWLNGLFGLGVFELAGRLRYNITIVYQCICITVYILFFHMRENSINTINWIAYQQLSYKFVLWVSTIVAIVCIILGFIYAEYPRKIIARCQQVDNTLELFGVQKNYTTMLWTTTCSILLWAILMLTLYTINILWIANEVGVMHGIYLSTAIHIPISISCMMLLSFCIYIRVLQDKLQKLNVAMVEVYKLSNTNNVNIKYTLQSYIGRKILVAMDYNNQKSFVLHFLQVTRHVHLEIVKISRKLNEIYCYQLLLQLVIEFTIIVGALCNIYFEVTKLNIMEALKNQITLSMAFWVFVSSIKVLVINNLCTGLHRKAQAIAQTFRELEASYLDDCIRNEVQQFSSQLTLHPLCFSAGEFVFLNNQLTTVFFGTITTYIAILFQMSSTPSAMKSLTQIVNIY